MTDILEAKNKIAKITAEAALKVQKSGKLPEVALPEVFIERPQNPDHGDYATSYPLKVARAVGGNPMTIAQEIVKNITPAPELEKIEVAKPGFINFTFKKDWLTGQINTVLAQGEDYGNVNVGNGSKVQIEFVSVNPTGPLHVGHGRGAILGSSLANVLAATNHKVTTEYYINDAGTQMNIFYQSLWVRYQQAFGVSVEMMPEGYQGAYMIDLAKEIIGEVGDKFIKLPADKAVAEIGKIGLEKMLSQIKTDLELMSVKFDVWFSERTLYQKGEYDTVMSMLRKSGYIAEKDNATWFVSTALGEDKDNVVIRGDGSPTYFAADIAYHYNKFIERKFDKVIDIWGADHQGHVSRMKAVVGALGIDPKSLEVIISQMVTLKRGKELVRVSKRSGDLITLREVIEEVGKDACRYFFLSRSANSQMDFDLELAKAQSDDNPVYYIQYAHARIASIMRLADEKKIDFSDGDVSLLTGEPEMTLIREVVLLPELVERIAKSMEPHHLTYYALDLATVFHMFYTKCRVVTDDEAATKARLKLVQATKIVLAKTLGLMGMSVPDRM